MSDLLQLCNLTVALPPAAGRVKPVNEVSLRIASLPVVAQLASHIAAMRAGQLVEYGLANLILHQPTHAYTRG